MRDSFILPSLGAYDVVLVNLPGQSRRNEFDYRRSVPPLGLGYIATFLKERGINVGVLDAECHQLAIDDIVGLLESVSPTFVGINCYSSGVLMCRTLLQNLSHVGRQRILGGPHVTAKPEEFSDFENTISVVGFGEQPMFDIIKGNVPPHEKVIKNRQITNEIVELNVDQNFFKNKIIDNGLKEGVLISSRGCPYTCKYCMSAESKYIFRSMSSTLAGIRELVEQYGAEVIHFLDDIIFPSNARLRKFIDAVVEEGLYEKFSWRGLLSIDVLKKMDCALLEESRCSNLSIGLESGSDRILHLVGKHYTIDDVLRVFEKIERTSVKLKLFFIVGIPTETSVDIELTRNLLRAAKNYTSISEINIFQFKPYPGTALYNEYFQDRPVKFFYHDLRESHADRIVSLEMERALAKDTYFCEHELLSVSLSELQDTMIDMYTDFYSR